MNEKTKNNIGHTAHFGGAIIGLLTTIAFVPSVIISQGHDYIGYNLIIAAFIFKRKY